MSGILLDTDILSELVRPKPDPHVQTNVRAQAHPLISALTIHELVSGAEPPPTRPVEPG